MPSFFARFLIFLVRVYQKTLSPLLGPSCRFEPSCSHYSVECLRSFGAIRGSWLTLRRIAKCQPFHPGGYDPPPQSGAASAGSSATSGSVDPNTTSASAACTSQTAQLADTSTANALTSEPPHAPHGRHPDGTHE